MSEAGWLGVSCWLHTSFFLGVLGNTYILYITTKYPRQVKLDRMSRWLTQNLAVADICNCVFVVAPIMVAVYSDGWVLGVVGCSVFISNYYTFFVGNVLFINLLSLNKLYRCVFPLRSLATSSRSRRLASAAVAGFSLLPFLYIWARLGSGVYYIKMYSAGTTTWLVGNEVVRSSADPYPSIWKNLCFGFLNDFHDISQQSVRLNRIVHLALAIVFNLLPLVVLIISNAALIGYAVKKSNSGINKTNLLMVILVTESFVFSFLPHFMTNLVVYIAVNPQFRQYSLGCVVGV